MDAIGQRLKEERLRKGWSQRDLSRETGVNADTISGIETGQHEPRPSTLRRLTEGLGIEVRDLFAEPALPKARAPKTGQSGQQPTKRIPNSLEELLRQRGVRSRHLVNENLKDTLDKLSYEEVFQITRELRAEVEAIAPDLRHFVEQHSRNTGAMSLLSEVAKQFWIARLTLAVRREQEFVPVELQAELDKGIHELQRGEELALAGVS